ncbi:MAG: hypothetical protein K6B28_03105 [Lachnospiraceae bacterium]|nr:hypothetical protein [Lachnospiraceae bacterium]
MILLVLLTVGCSSQSNFKDESEVADEKKVIAEEEEIAQVQEIMEAEEPGAEVQESTEAEKPGAQVQESMEAEEPGAQVQESKEAEDTPAKGQEKGYKLTDEMAVDAVMNYCYINNPDLKEIVEEGVYSVYWSVVSSDEKEIVVLYRSYTAALVRYYIDRISGETYETQFVEGITPEEERSDESFNIWDYVP